MLWNEFAIAEIEALWRSRIEIWDAFHEYILRIFYNAGWIVEVLFMLSLAYIAV